MVRYDVLTIGNAIVDIIARTDEAFLADNSIIKGAMNLIDAERAELLYEKMATAVETSGGSAANTAAGLAGLGAHTAFLGKVATDHLGKVFAHDIHAQNVSFDTPPLVDKIPTARCLVFVTADGERSMNTYLGACTQFGPEDIEASKIACSDIIYFEGYLWDPARAKEAIRMAAQIAHENGNRVAMTLSDPFCVDRYRDEFLQLMRSKTVDIVFSNEAEIKSLYQTESFSAAIDAVRLDCPLTIITCSEKGAVVVTREQTIEVDAFPVEEVQDSTGAGDLFAAGFLYGLTHEMDLRDSARLGAFVAALVIQQIGPRLQVNLRELAEQQGLL